MGVHLIFYRAKFHIFSESEGIEAFGTTYWRNVMGVGRIWSLLSYAKAWPQPVFDH